MVVRDHLWTFRGLHSEDNYIVGCDFNVALAPSDKMGGRMMGSCGSLDFKNLCDDLTLADVRSR